jgi:hypothetical protein
VSELGLSLDLDGVLGIAIKESRERRLLGSFCHLAST